MKHLFLKLILILLLSVLAFPNGFCGGYYCYIEMPSQALPYHGKAKCKATCLTFDQYIQGNWYLYLKSDNPAVSFTNLYNLTAPGIGLLTKRSDGLYELPYLTQFYGSQNDLEIEFTYDSLMGTSSTAGISLSLFYIGKSKDSVVTDVNGDPYQYYNQLTRKARSTITFLPSTTIRFADYTLSPTATVCDTILYNVTVKGKGYSTLSDFHIQANLPNDFTYLPHTSQIRFYDRFQNALTFGSTLTEPLIQNDTSINWDLSTQREMGFIKQDSTNYFIVRFKLLPKPGYTKDSISGTVSATKSSGGIIQKTIPRLILDPASQPSPILLTLPDTIKLTEGEELLLSASDNSSSYTYVWEKDNQATEINTHDFQISSTLQADSGIYRCTAYNQCHAVSSNATVVKVKKVIVPTPEENPTPEDNSSTTEITGGIKTKLLTAYPNPSSGIIFLSTEMKSASYTLTDLTGTPVQQGTIASDGSVNLQDVPNGFYFLQIRKNGQIHSVKISKN